MVQLIRSDHVTPPPGRTPPSFGTNQAVKLEVEDSLYDEHGPHKKRSKSTSSSSSSTHFDQQRSTASKKSLPPSQYNPLDDPSPLGLKLRKSPSLLDLIQMRLSQDSNSSNSAALKGNFKCDSKTGASGITASIVSDKLKASNFPALLLRIGRWEYVSRYEGDLITKCYFAKHKLVWEVLDGGLKSKIEIQWSDIMALNAKLPDDGPGTLTLALARQPLFFKETNPQPRKHTLWQATADFTDGQASIHRQHFLQFPQGLLNKHYEKLIHCDSRLNFLSLQPEIHLDSPYFEVQSSLSENPTLSRDNDFNELENSQRPSISNFQDQASPCSAQSSSLGTEHHVPVRVHPEYLSKKDPSSSAVMDAHVIEGSGNCEAYDCQDLEKLEELKVPGIHPSLSMCDLVNHLEHCISEQVTAKNLPSEKATECQFILDDIAQILLSDTQVTTLSDEKCLMKKVNSLCCLLQDPLAPNIQVDGDCNYERFNEGKDASDSLEEKTKNGILTCEESTKHVQGYKQTAMISRKESLGDLLIQLPRIASISNFLFDIEEDNDIPDVL